MDARRAAYAATGAMLGVALVANAALRNDLWFWYTCIGTGAYLVFLGLVRHRRLAPPPRAVAMGGVAAGLHYVGGSLSGVHWIGGPNGLYAAFPWWDNVVHALGAGAVAVIAAAALAGTVPRPALRAFLAVTVAVFFGVVVELYEFAMFVLFGTVDQGFYTNNLLDLYDNLLGATLAAGLYVAAEEVALAAEATDPGPA